MKRLFLLWAFVALLAPPWSLLEAHQIRGPEVGGFKVLLENEFPQLYNAGDAPGLATLWTNDGSFTSTVLGKEPATGRASIENTWAAEFKRYRQWPNLSVLLRNARVISGRHAEVDGIMTYSSTAAPTGPTVDFVATLVDEEGRWKIVSMRTSLIVEPFEPLR